MIYTTNFFLALMVGGAIYFAGQPGSGIPAQFEPEILIAAQNK